MIGVFTREAVTAAYLDSPLQRLLLILVGETYYARSPKETLALVRAAGVHEIPYAELGNCREYAETLRWRVYRLSGWWLGLVCDYGGRHVYNAVPVIDDKGGLALKILEPQTGRFAVPGSLLRATGHERYDLVSGAVWL